MFADLGTRARVVIVEAGEVRGDRGMVKAVGYDGSRNVKLTAWGDENDRVSDLGKVLLGVGVGDKVDAGGRVTESEKYGVELALVELRRVP